MVSSATLEYVYGKLPVPFQDALCSYYGRKEARIRFSEVFERRLEELLDSERWSAAEAANYQDEQLRRLIRHAYDSVPYYRDRMKGLKLTPADIQSRQDLAKLPILSKEEVRANMPRLVSENQDPQRLIHRHTSGTSGKSLHFLSTPDSIAFQWAVWWRHRMRFGIQRGTWHANFTGKLVVPAGQVHPPYWRWNRPMHQVLVNMQHLTPQKIGDIVSFFDERGFELFTGYPSIIHAFVLAAEEAGRKLQAPPRVICTGAENILDFQRRDIVRSTGAILTDQYGLSEGCGNASHCPEFAYHEDFEFGILECADPVRVDQNHTRGRIVCTGFSNRAFPFIRYDTGDIGIWRQPDYSCACGRSSAVLSGIDGRKDDYVITPEGNRIMRFDYIFKDTANVKECQVVQESLGEITLRIVRRPPYGVRDEETIRREISHWISPRLRVKFDYVPEIERSASGKFKAVKSLLPAQQSGARN